MRPTSLHVEPRGAKATARHYIRDLVYGANDGIITTFAVVSGVAGGQLSQLAVLVVGAANLAADGVSMGVGNFLAIRADERAREADGLPELERASVETWACDAAGVCRRWCDSARTLCAALVRQRSAFRVHRGDIRRSVSAWRRSCVDHQGPLVADGTRDAGARCRRRGGGLCRRPTRGGRSEALIVLGQVVAAPDRRHHLGHDIQVIAMPVSVLVYSQLGGQRMVAEHLANPS